MSANTLHGQACRPILFSAEMVRAILAGRKSQTRRIIKPQPTEHVTGGTYNWKGSLPFVNMPIESILDACPYGQPGSLLWVRETWRADEDHDGPFIYYAADGTREYGLIALAAGMANPYINGKEACRPSIFMPRWASRITLEIVSVRVERLQDISEDDAIAEGIQSRQSGTLTLWRDYSGPGEVFGTSARSSYFSLWDSINGDGAWMKNPWIWRIEFRRATPHSVPTPGEGA